MSSIAEFIKTQIIADANSKVSTKDVSDRYNSLYSSGRNNMHKALREHTGTPQGAKFYVGYKLVEPVKPTINETPVVATPVSTMTEFERQTIEAKQRKIAMFEALKQQELEAAECARKEAAEQAERARKEAAEQAERARKEAAELEAKKLEYAERARKEAAELEAKKLEYAERARIEAAELKAKKLEQDERFHRDNQEMKKLQQEHEWNMQERKLEWGSHENNKNRLFTMINHPKFHEYRDIVAYGSPAQQFADVNSAIKVLCGEVFVHTTRYLPKLEETIESNFKKLAQDEVVYKNDTKNDETLRVITLENCKEAAKESIDNFVSTGMINPEDAQNMEECLDDSLKSYITKVDYVGNVHKNLGSCTNVVPDHVRTIEREVAKTKKGSSKDKRTYHRHCSRVAFSKDGITSTAECFGCGSRCNVEGNGFHRAHDHPEALGGSWDVENVFGACAICNHEMKTQQVIDYKLSLYQKLKAPVIDEIVDES